MNADLARYPAHLARMHALADGRTVLVRPVRPQDEALARTFFAGLSDESRHLRFFCGAVPITDALMRFYTRIDYERHMAFFAEWQGRIVGDARYIANPGTRSCELGIVIADGWHHSGVAALLMQALMQAARSRGFETIEGMVLRANANMLGFVRDLGFEIEPLPHEPSIVRVVKRL